ncbi:MAG: enoyl-CoA hydratase/isomerase family protein [Lentimicrobium sp.]|jgi:methylglutaconyl-CoA hydratase|nr:enoyl-CoA hydratase/isomerase family protein [Lentimicrobium sp.]
MNTNYNTLEIGISNQTATIWLNRPEIRNAFNEVMISELIKAFNEVSALDDVRVVVLRGHGKSFCAGADLNWMRGVAQYSYEQNYQESLQLSDCFFTIYNCPKPTIAVVHGAAIGGANGLLSACDMAICDDETVFSLSEVKIGIVPACISPYVIKRVGEYGAKELMLTGKRIKGKEAEHFRLVNKSLPDIELDAYLDELISLLKSSGPKAMTQCKTLIDQVSNKITLTEALSYTAQMIAEIRASEEGQEGMAAFLEKRKPKWNC